MVYLFSKTQAAYLYKVDLAPITGHRKPSFSILSRPT